MRSLFYVHAFCLDENKAQDEHPEMLSGPYQGLSITWDFLRGMTHDDRLDHEYIRAESGFWHPVVHLVTKNGTSMTADYVRGRFTDLVFLNTSVEEDERWLDRNAVRRVPYVPKAAREVVTEAEHDEWSLFEAAEQEWLERPECTCFDDPTQVESRCRCS